MNQEPRADVIRHTVMVPAPVETAFEIFTARFNDWWPVAYTWAGDAEVLDAIAIEPREGGRCFERGPHGFECDWGRVLTWEPPRRLVFTWQISPQREPQPDAAKASEVEVHFEAQGADATRVRLEHRGFARHGQGSAGYREALGSEQGWPWILGRYVERVAGGD